MFSGLTKTRVLLSLLCIAAVSVFVICSSNVSAAFSSHHKSSACSCHSCLTEGYPWFRDLINASPNPFLSRTNRTPEDAFNWWKRLQAEHRTFSFYNATVEKLFKIFPPVPDVEDSRPDRCRTCAVVGNSGNLKGSHYGPLIDLHDVVIRMNRGRTKGYESDVGTKTTHHVMYPESAAPLENTTHLVFVPFKIKDLLWLLRTFDPGNNSPVSSKNIANKDLVMILNPAFIKYVHERWLASQGTYPSTGFLTLVLGMQLCDKVSVFGFGADGDGNWSHYFEALRNKKLRTGHHPGRLEYEVIRLLHKTQKITFFKGW